jgi:hypothetical protein
MPGQFGILKIDGGRPGTLAIAPAQKFEQLIARRRQCTANTDRAIVYGNGVINASWIAANESGMAMRGHGDDPIG